MSYLAEDTIFHGFIVSYIFMLKKYSVKEKVSDDILEQLLFNRNIKTKKAREAFLNPDFKNHLHDPFLLPDMDKAVRRILKAVKEDEKIGIWSDYDADGIPGGAALHDFFKMIGFSNFINYIPNRHTEGYGLSTEGLDQLKKEGVGLIITVDCGVRENEKIEYGKKLGMDLIVTDHHEPAESLPEALAVVNPKRKDSQYPEQILCGAGVAWKLIEAILQTERSLLKEGQEKWLLDLVGLATLSDSVPLLGENRALAHFGLMVMKRGKRPGLGKLLSRLGINRQNLTEDDIYFMITPRINAASRMGQPMDAFSLLTAESPEEADEYAKHLHGINEERKIMVAGLTKEAKKKIKEKFESQGEQPVIVLGNPEWRPAVLGLVASHLAEEYGRPVFLWGRENGDCIKGSCRSDGDTDLVALMEKIGEHFLEFGGHKMSGGFSVSFEKIHTLEAALVAASSSQIKAESEIWADAELSLKDVSERLAGELSRLAPFGASNSKPLFIFREVVPERINRFGKNKEHLSVNLRDGSSSVRAISFFTAPDQFGDALQEGLKTNLVANVEKSFWNGSSELRLRIVDFF